MVEINFFSGRGDWKVCVCVSYSKKWTKHTCYKMYIKIKHKSKLKKRMETTILLMTSKCRRESFSFHDCSTVEFTKTKNLQH